MFGENLFKKIITVVTIQQSSDAKSGLTPHTLALIVRFTGPSLFRRLIIAANSIKRDKKPSGFLGTIEFKT
jgi:hypothetical protein